MKKTEAELRAIVEAMRSASAQFYASAVQIGNHPFIEFAGLLNEYIKCCEEAAKKSVDFTNCNAHAGAQLPMPSYSVAYVNEKLTCIFTGRATLREDVDDDDIIRAADELTLYPKALEITIRGRADVLAFARRVLEIAGATKAGKPRPAAEPLVVVTDPAAIEHALADCAEA